MALQAPTARMTEEEYRAFALGDGAGQWELVRGELREKPEMSVEHGGTMVKMLRLLLGQLDENEYGVRVGHARLRRAADTYYVPDIAVIPATLERALLEKPGSLDAYSEPLLLVIEIWSPSTGRYDIRDKLPDYQARGDREIWYVHPYERTITVWRQNPDGNYTKSVHSGGELRPESLPGVVFDLDVLFDL